MSAVSLPAKNAARMSNPANAQNRVPKEGCGTRPGLAPMSPEHILEDEFHPEIRHGQYTKAAQGPLNGRTAAPSESNAPDHEHAEQRPGDERQGGLLHQVLREQIGDEDKPREQRQGQQTEAGSNQ